MFENSSKEKLKKQIDKLGKEISALKQKQADLHFSEERFQTIFDSMDEVYFEIDLKGNLTYCNPALCKLSGYSSDELMGKNNREYVSFSV
ncbi:MAG: PAS domain-containing protein [Dissulfuribacterales bacterium]